MQKKFILLALLFMAVLFSRPVAAQIEFTDIQSKFQEKLKVTGFPDYYPFGAFDPDSGDYKGVFLPFLKEFAERGKYDVTFVSSRRDYAGTIRDAAKGKSDIVLGIYNDTSLYRDLKYIYPAALINPIHVVMLPSRIKELKSVKDLQKMKGAIHKQEYFSDYLKRSLAPYQLETVDNSHDLFGKLITGEIDYIFTSLYFGVIEASKLGVRHQIAFSKQSLWRIPLFIGISKASYHREYLSQKLTKELEQQSTRDRIQQNMMDLITKAEAENDGVVPPSYTLQK